MIALKLALLRCDSRCIKNSVGNFTNLCQLVITRNIERDFSGKEQTGGILTLLNYHPGLRIEEPTNPMQIEITDENRQAMK
jgi:hypothetical protein